MKVTPEELAAYADGELDAARAAEIEAAIAADPDLAAQLSAHRQLRQLLSAHYDPIAAQPVPDRFAALLGGGAAEEQPAPAVIDFAAAREAREARRRLPRWTWVAGPAIAASLALLVLVRTPGGRAADYAPAQLAGALDSRLSGEAGEPRILLSFANDAGELCRAYAGADASGIACRDGQGWRIDRKAGGSGAGQTDYRQAGSAAEELMAAAQDMAGERGALDPAAEAAARAKGWH